jgi:hypothetical protein
MIIPSVSTHVYTHRAECGKLKYFYASLIYLRV